MERKIEFRKTRDFGEKFNATFEFLRQEFKPLFKGILYISGPFIAIAAVVGAYYQKYSLSLLNLSFENPEEILTDEFGLFASFLLISSLVAYAIIFAVVNEYVKQYILAGNRSLTFDELLLAVKKNIMAYLGSVFGYLLIIIFFSLFAGFVIVGVMALDNLLINFLMFMGIFVLIFALIVFFYMTLITFNTERPDFISAINRTLQLLKGHWWSTIGLMLIAWILVALVSMVFSLPNSILTTIGVLHEIDTDGVTELSFFQELMFAITSFISSAGGFFLTIILMLILIFQYFNLVERKDATGLMERIESIGKEKNKPEDDEDF